MLRKLEKYEILEEIGHGGMATVYRAHDTVLDRPVALKVMHPHLRAAEEARRRFHREARSVARLRHPRVLEIYDFSGEGSDEAYIAAELLTGPTLKQWREQREEVPAEIAACFAIEIGSALEAAHAANIVHRDVKPENVLLHEDREIKLTDFGIADMIDAQSMTATGQILGSPGHMAPEQIEGKDCDARTDLFSLGTVLYYLATGRLPFTGRNPHQVLKRIVDGEYADPLRVNPTIGGRLRAIIVKALERDPDVRYQSAREMIEELEAFLAEAGIEDSAQMLERYLKDPEKVGAEVRAQVIHRLIDRGARASDAGDVPAALDYYNRVLALDEGNERVLKLIERVGMDRRRRAILTAAAGLTVLGAVAAAGAWALWPEPHVDDGRPVPIDSPMSDAGADAGTAEIAQAELDAGPPDSGPTEVAAAPTRATGKGRACGRCSRRRASLASSASPRLPAS
ncbi:MAG: serine/threonine protein kinase [Sandaracinaceae bacterium]|nr:serine/threonine protein kinase [Sandaracinaceae bacterium]